MAGVSCLPAPKPPFTTSSVKFLELKKSKLQSYKVYISIALSYIYSGDSK